MSSFKGFYLESKMQGNLLCLIISCSFNYGWIDGEQNNLLSFLHQAQQSSTHNFVWNIICNKSLTVNIYFGKCLAWTEFVGLELWKKEIHARLYLFIIVNISQFQTKVKMYAQKKPALVKYF